MLCRRIVLSLFIFAVATNVAFTMEMSEIVVEGRAPSITSPDLPAARHEASRVPGGTSVVDTEQTKKGRSTTVVDSLSLTPGVFAQSRQGSEEARVSIRGSGLQRTFHGRGIKLLQDGSPLNLADGSFDFQAIEPLSSRYVSVYRGANALEFGSATLGGAINYVSRTGYDASPLQARFEAGSFNYYRGQISSGRVLGATDYYGSVSSYYQTGFRDHSRQNTQRFFGNAGHKFSDTVENRMYLTAVLTDSELAGSLTKAEMNKNPKSANPANVSGNQKRDFKLVRLANKTSLASGGNRFDVDGYYSWKHLDHPISIVVDQESHDAGLSAKYSADGEIAGRQNRFVAGIAPAAGRVHDERYVNVSGGRGNKTGDSDQTSLNLAAFAEDQHMIQPRWAFVLGAQAAYAVRKNKDNFPVSPTDPDNSDRQTYTGVSPKVGLRFDASPHAQVFANVSGSFEPPSFGELVGNNASGGLVKLDAQTATTFEIGSRGDGRIVKWDVSAYHALLKRELLSLTDANGNPLGTVNADDTIHEGLETGLGLVLPFHFVLQNSYTLNHFRFDDDKVFGNNQLAGLPKHVLRADLSYEHPAGFYAGPNVEWVPSKYPIDHKNTFYADAYAIVGFKMGYKTGKGLSLFIDGRNLTDETYAATTGVIANANGNDARQFLPGDGRSVFGGAEWNF